MKNNKLQKIFFKTFLVTILTIIFIAGVGIATYAIVNNLFGEDEYQQAESAQKNMSIIANVTLGTPSFEVIYDADENDSKINHIVVAVFNTQTHNLDYLTIPAATQYKLSDKLYADLAQVNEDIPQTIKLSELPNYFSGKEVYEYGELVLGDMLGVNMSYYTKITSSEFENYFTESETSFYSPKKATFTDTLVYSSTFIDSYKDVKAETVINFLTDYSNNTSSNLNMTDRTKYASDYAKVAGDKIYYWHAFGDYSDAGHTFTIDLKNTKGLLKTILSSASYTVTQEEYNNTLKKASSTDSKKLKIQILNGAGVKGLAGKWQKKLNADGYHVENVSDYKNDNVKKTNIVVKKDSVGLDLIRYFSNAKIKVGEVPDGYDILIIIGSEDNLD